VIDRLLEPSTLAGPPDGMIDRERIGVAGLSLGGLTTLLVATTSAATYSSVVREPDNPWLRTTSGRRSVSSGCGSHTSLGSGRSGAAGMLPLAGVARLVSTSASDLRTTGTGPAAS
jgi:hypothetical protein